MRRLFSYAIYPVLMAASVTAAILLIPSVREDLLVPGAILVVGAIAALLERAMPHEPTWRAGTPLATDVTHLIVSMGLATAVFRALTFGALFAASAWLTGAAGALWPTTWPLVAQL